MKILFWSALILGAVWWFLKNSVGQGNDLTTHFQEQKALQSIGNTATAANQIGTGNWPLATIGNTPLAGVPLDPFNSDNPFTRPSNVEFMQATPTSPQQVDYSKWQPGDEWTRS